MSLTRKVLLFTLGLCTVAALVSFVPLSFGREGKPSNTARAAVTSAVYPPARASAASKGSRVRYLEQNGVAQPGQDNGFSFKCPKKTPNAISGYFYAVRNEADGKVLLAGSFPFGKSRRNWAVGVVNNAAQPEEFVTGVVCIR